MRKTHAALVLATLTWANAGYAATIVSNGTGGGDFATGGTWVGNNPPLDDNFVVATGDNVTANGVTLASTNSTNPTVNGTLTLENGSSFTGINRLNYSSTPAPTAGGILNINTSSSMYVGQVRPPAASDTLTVNLATGGLLSVSGGVMNAPAALTVNVNPGGTYITTGAAGESINLAGGTTVNYNVAGIVQPTTWTSGTVIVKSLTTGSTIAGQLSGFMNNNPADVLQIGNSTAPQTVTWSNTQAFQLTQTTASSGSTIVMHAYTWDTSSQASDLMSWTNGQSGYKVLAGTTLQFEDDGDLPGDPSDYLGQIYQLFVNGNYAADINPTVAPAMWDINGTEYNVTFTNDLNSNGTLVVSGLTVVPEPATIGLLGASMLLALRRRRRVA